MFEDPQQNLAAFGGIHDSNLCISKFAKSLCTHFHEGFFKIGKLFGYIIGTTAVVSVLRVSITFSLLINDRHFIGLFSQAVGYVGHLFHGVDKGVFVVAYTDEQNFGTHLTQTIPGKTGRAGSGSLFFTCYKISGSFADGP